MKRNKDRIYFDKGYQEAIRNRKVENFWPKVISIWSLFLSAAWEWKVAFFLVFIYTIFEYAEYRDTKNYSPDVKIPPFWE